jgi:hypothetical protein
MSGRELGLLSVFALVIGSALAVAFRWVPFLSKPPLPSDDELRQALEKFWTLRVAVRLNGPLRPHPRIRNPRPRHFHPMVKIFEFCIPMARTQVPAGTHELAVDESTSAPRAMRHHQP